MAIPLKLTGPIPALLALIDLPPLGYAKAVGLQPGDVTGNAEGQVALNFPLTGKLGFSDVDLNATVHLTNAATAKLVKGIVIGQGDIMLDVTKARLIAKGNASLNNTPAQIVWQENFIGQPLRTATITGTIGDAQWSAFNINLEGMLKGDTPYTLQVTAPNKLTTVLNGSLDLTGDEIIIEDLNWKKSAGIKGGLTFTSTIPTGKDIQVSAIDMEAPNLTVKGSAVLDAGGHTKSLDFPGVAVGRTKADIRFTVGADGRQTYIIEGEALDISGMIANKTPTAPVTAVQDFRFNVGKFYTGNDSYMTSVAGALTRDKDGWQVIDIQGIAGGSHKFYVNLDSPPGLGKSLSAGVDDFGAALQAAGFTGSIQGGDLLIQGSSTPEAPSVINGKATIGAFAVKDLPLLVLLLNATSLGINNILNDKVPFDHLRGKFIWQGHTVDLININAAGGAIGINTSGRIDTDTGEGHLHGTLVPFSMVNRILGAIPGLGYILTGGSGGGVFAATYHIDGPLAQPNITVNPIALLTPGFLRNLFFGGPSTNEDEQPLPDDPSTASAAALPVGTTTTVPVSTAVPVPVSTGAPIKSP